MEVVLLLGLASLGYALAQREAKEQEEKPAKKDAKVTWMEPERFDSDQVELENADTGHSNMVPFFGAHVTQSTYSGATSSLLDKYTGQGKDTFFHKDETPAFFAPETGNGNPFGVQIETDFEQSRQVSSMRMNNVFPVERVQVGPGVNDGYTNLPSGGYQQFTAAQEYALPPTTDELRVKSKPKLTYEGEVVPGAHYVTEMGIQAPVKKNRPDRFAITGLERANTTTGQQVASGIYPTQVMKLQNRESTSTQFTGGPQSANTYLNYIRAFTEPFEEFMKLTVEGRQTPGGMVGGMGIQAGPESINVATHRNEHIFDNVRTFETPMLTVGGQPTVAGQQGVVQYTEPLKQDIYARDVGTSGLLDAFKSNPYTQSLQSI